jgi:hypothetical protein
VDLRDLVAALLRRDALSARQWVADAARAGFDWRHVAEPHGLDPAGRAVAAAVVEMMAERSDCQPAAWTSAVPAAPERLFLVQAAEVLPRLRRLCEEEGPEPLRRRGLLAPPGFLTAA